MRRAFVPAAAAVLALGLSPARVRAQEADPLEALDRAGRALSERCSPAVVRVDAERGLRLRVVADTEEERRSMEESLRRSTARESVSAAGFLLDDEGLVLTTSAVTGGATSLRVLFPGGAEREGVVLGEDDLAGVALLRIPPVEGIRSLRFSERDARPGTLSLFLAPEGDGSPGLRIGFVTSARRAFGLYDAWLVSSVPLEAGQAGAPLLDARGDVLGMALAPRISVTIRTVGPADGGPRTGPEVADLGGTLGRLIERSRTVERGPGFSTFVPAGELKRIAADLRGLGRVRRGLLGVRMARGEPVVREVPAEHPAAKAGIGPGDRILAVDGVAVSSAEEATGFIRRRAPGSSVAIRLRSPGAPDREVTVVLGEAPVPAVRRALFNGLRVAEKETYDLSAAKFRTLEVEGGRYMVVESVAEDSAAARAGILPGDWIVEVRRRPVLSERDYVESATSGAASEESVEVMVYRAGDAERRVLVLK